MSIVAQTILQQIGGNKFVVMTGAKNLMATPTGLHFSIGRGAKQKINKVTINLDPSDTYTMTFYNIRGVNVKEISSKSMVYADQLCDIFTDETGFYTSL